MAVGLWNRIKELASQVNQLGQAPQPGANHPDAYMWRYAKAPLDSRVTRLMSLGAILNEDNRLPVNVVETRQSSAIAVPWLAEAWSIHDATTARHQLDGLLEHGHGPILDDAQRLCRDPAALETMARLHPEWPPSDREEFVRYAPGARAVLAEIELMPADAPPITAKAYDLGRAVTVARMAVGAAYLQEDDALHVASRAGRIALQLFAGWPDYARSYVLGRAIWGGDSPHLRNQGEIAKMFLDHPASPWLTAGWLRADEL